MFSAIWHNVFFDPVYNALVYFVSVIPGGDVGLAIIGLTILVKIGLLPLSVKASHTQRVMRDLEPKLKEIKEKHKNNREELARATMAAYKDGGINPFASILLLFIQLPIIIALYLSVYSGGGVKLPDINTDILYSFAKVPDVVSMMFLGMIDMASKSFPLAVLAGVTQFFQVRMTLPALPPRAEGSAPNFKDDMARSMNLNMRYVLPLIIFFVAYTISASIALYFTISNVTGIVQELIIPTRSKENAAEGSLTKA